MIPVGDGGSVLGGQFRHGIQGGDNPPPLLVGMAAAFAGCAASGRPAAVAAAWGSGVASHNSIARCHLASRAAFSRRLPDHRGTDLQSVRDHTDGLQIRPTANSVGYSLTATYGRGEDHAAGRAAGFDLHPGTPIDLQQLQAALTPPGRKKNKGPSPFPCGKPTRSRQKWGGRKMRKGQNVFAEKARIRSHALSRIPTSCHSILLSASVLFLFARTVSGVATVPPQPGVIVGADLVQRDRRREEGLQPRIGRIASASVMRWSNSPSSDAFSAARSIPPSRRNTLPHAQHVARHPVDVRAVGLAGQVRVAGCVRLRRPPQESRDALAPAFSPQREKLSPAKQSTNRLLSTTFSLPPWIWTPPNWTAPQRSKTLPWTVTPEIMSSNRTPAAPQCVPPVMSLQRFQRMTTPRYSGFPNMSSPPWSSDSWTTCRIAFNSITCRCPRSAWPRRNALEAVVRDPIATAVQVNGRCVGPFQPGDICDGAVLDDVMAGLERLPVAARHPGPAATQRVQRTAEDRVPLAALHDDGVAAESPERAAGDDAVRTAAHVDAVAASVFDRQSGEDDVLDVFQLHKGTGEHAHCRRRPLPGIALRRQPVQLADAAVQIPFARPIQFAEHIDGPVALAFAVAVLGVGLGKRQGAACRLDGGDLLVLLVPVPEPVAVETHVGLVDPGAGPVLDVLESRPGSLGSSPRR